MVVGQGISPELMTPEETRVDSLPEVREGVFPQRRIQFQSMNLEEQDA